MVPTPGVRPGVGTPSPWWQQMEPAGSPPQLLRPVGVLNSQPRGGGRMVSVPKTSYWGDSVSEARQELSTAGAGLWVAARVPAASCWAGSVSSPILGCLGSACIFTRKL